MNLRVVKERGDGTVQAVLLTEGPGQVEEQLSPHHLVTVDTSHILHLQARPGLFFRINQGGNIRFYICIIWRKNFPVSQLKFPSKPLFGCNQCKILFLGSFLDFFKASHELLLSLKLSTPWIRRFSCWVKIIS